MVKKYESKLWKEFLLNNDDGTNRKNNALERYIRRGNDTFSNAYPNLANLIEVIKSEFKYYQEHKRQIRQNPEIRFIDKTHES
ncbi:hypothetical protein HZS_3767 [Henneguya salminicola]|nr:hypothetical protein HZS_3767 [Henneguya salminicola]